MKLIDNLEDLFDVIVGVALVLMMVLLMMLIVSIPIYMLVNL